MVVDVNIIQRPTPGYLTSFNEGCVGFPVNFLDISTDVFDYMWDFGDGTGFISNEQNPTYTFDSAGTYRVTLTAIGLSECSAMDSSHVIIVHDSAIANYTSAPQFPVEIAFPNTEVDFTNLSQNSDHWFWDFGDMSFSTDEHPSHMFTDTGMYNVTLVAISDGGCHDTISYGPFVVKEPELFIPNVFSPNGDGVNDQFIVNYTGSQPFLVEIYDRWGGMVFNTRDQYVYWQGTRPSGKEVPESVYYYAVTIGNRKFAGPVTLMR